MSASAPSWRPNHEGSVAVGRSILGAIPFLLIVLLTVAPLAFAWLAGPGSPILLGLIVGLLSVGLVAAGWGIYSVVSRTPRAVGIGKDGISAAWGTIRPTTQFIPFERVTSVAPAGWKWYVEGRVVFARFTPGLVRFEDFDSDDSADRANAPVSDGILYVTRANERALESALSGWRDDSVTRNEGALGPQVMDEETARELGEV